MWTSCSRPTPRKSSSSPTSGRRARGCRRGRGMAQCATMAIGACRRRETGRRAVEVEPPPAAASRRRPDCRSRSWRRLRGLERRSSLVRWLHRHRRLRSRRRAAGPSIQTLTLRFFAWACSRTFATAASTMPQIVASSMNGITPGPTSSWTSIGAWAIGGLERDDESVFGIHGGDDRASGERSYRASS